MAVRVDRWFVHQHIHRLMYTHGTWHLWEQARAADALKEFFVSEEMGEMRRSVEELNCPVYHYELVKRCVIAPTTLACATRPRRASKACLRDRRR